MITQPSQVSLLSPRHNTYQCVPSVQLEEATAQPDHTTSWALQKGVYPRSDLALLQECPRMSCELRPAGPSPPVQG